MLHLTAHKPGCAAACRPGVSSRPPFRTAGLLGSLKARDAKIPRTCRTALLVVCEKASNRGVRRQQPWRDLAQKRFNDRVARLSAAQSRRSRSSSRTSSRGTVEVRQKKRRKSRAKSSNKTEEEDILQGIVNDFDLSRGKAQLKALLEIGLSYADLRKLLTSRMEVTCYRPSTIRRKLKFFTEVVGMNQQEMRKILLKFPRLLEYNCEETLGPRLRFLGSLGVEQKDFPKIFLQAPAVMELSIRKTLHPRVQYLQAELGLPDMGMGTIIFRHPQLLTYTTESMAERVNFLQSFGLRDEKLQKSIISHPQVLHYSVEAMDSRVKYLRSIGVTKEGLPKMLARMPQLLSLNIKVNMAPKIEYLCEELGGCYKTIETNPTYLAMSLQNRIIPRYEFMKEKSEKALKHPAPMNWFKCSDQVFAGRIAKVPLAEFVAFKEHMLTV